MPNHGVYVSEVGTSVSTPNVATSGIPFVVGAAPLDGEHPATAGSPVLLTSWDEVIDKISDDPAGDNWTTFPLCEFLYSHFKVFGAQPVIAVPLASGATTANVASAFEAVEQCLTAFGIVPDILVAPGYSNDATVSAAMKTKAQGINGMFRAKAIVDISAASYTAAISAKNAGSFDENHIVCWGIGTIGELKFHMSTLIAGRISVTDTDNNGCPYESPSNKSVYLDGFGEFDAGTFQEINLTLAHANALNAAGIVTSLNFMGGYVAWGNYTGCYPASTDVKDYYIPVGRMFGWVGNTLIKTFWSKLDRPMNRRLIDSILDSANIWLNGIVGSGYLLGARVVMLESENSLTNLMAGIIRLHVYMTPPSPAQEIDFPMEYDASYVEAALQG